MTLKIFSLILLIQAVTSCGTQIPDLIESSCVGEGWISFRDEKCFKLIETWAKRENAAELCRNEKLQSDGFIPTIAMIKSAEEQKALTEYIFEKSQISINVWIGAKRVGSGFKWEDSSEVEEFENWAPGFPTEDQRRVCVEMQSVLSRGFKNQTRGEVAQAGKWRDVSCDLPNFVVCEKMQKWSFGKLQQTLLKNRKDQSKTETELVGTKAILENTKAELGNTKSELATTKADLDSLQKNPVPIGFIYTQLPSQPEPNSIWPNIKWQDVTSSYAGLFFRAEGSGSAEFGQEQADNSPRLEQVQLVMSTHKSEFKLDLNLSPGLWSDQVYTGPATGEIKDGLKFRMSGGEVRPRNKAVKIWKRVA